MLFTALSVFATAKGQIAKWVIPPLYDDIKMVNDPDLFITHHADTTFIWNMNGKLLANTVDKVFPFREGKAVIVGAGTDNIGGYLNEKGKFTLLPDYPRNTVARSYPYFSNGFLLTRDKNQNYQFLNDKLAPAFGTYVDAYPFNKGYAACWSYVSLKRPKDLYYLYNTTSEEDIQFTYNKKIFDFDDVEFLSSLAEDGTSIAVIKHKVYYFSSSDKSLEPVLPTEEETDTKKQAVVTGNLGEYTYYPNDSTLVLTAQCGKSDEIRIEFSNFCIPQRIIFPDGHVKEYEQAPKPKAPVVKSTLKIDKSGKSDNVGIVLQQRGGNRAVLPPQFSEVKLVLADMAFVKMPATGKWGLLAIDKSTGFRFKMNKGDAIGFRHQTYDTQLRIDLPANISAKKTTLDVGAYSGCQLDKTSRVARDTESGNYVQYDCRLTIPDILPDVATTITYPVQVHYDGLVSPVYPLKVKAWHYKYFNLDIDEVKAEKGMVSFTVNVGIEKSPGEADYPFSLTVEADSVKWELEKLSETRYKCHLSELPDSLCDISINVLETGCPAVKFPLEVEYTKPQPAKGRGRNATAATKESVTVRKKSVATTKSE